MSGNENGNGKRSDREGPQGTRVFSQSEVDELLADASTPKDAGKQPSLRGVTAPIAGQRFILSDYRLVLGRANSCDIVIDEPSVSSEHARVSRDEEGWRVANLLSTNGTFVNDRKVSSSAIANGDRVRFGRVEFRFYDPDQSGGEKGKGGGLPLWPIIFSVIGIAIIAVVVATIL